VRTKLTDEEIHGSPSTVSFFKKKGQYGGRTRAKKLTAAQRSAITRKAPRARWGKKEGKSITQYAGPVETGFCRQEATVAYYMPKSGHAVYVCGDHAWHIESGPGWEEFVRITEKEGP